MVKKRSLRFKNKTNVSFGCKRLEIYLERFIGVKLDCNVLYWSLLLIFTTL